MPKKVLRYSEYGAVGDGVRDDLDAIAQTHAVANESGLPVCADEGAVYYIGSGERTAQIQTDTDWNTARFVIDDTKVENHRKSIFLITSKHTPIDVTNINSLEKHQERLHLDIKPESESGYFMSAVDNSTMRYIREGLNQDNGAPQTDVFIVNKNGEVDSRTGIIWDFPNITSLTAYPIDEKPLVIRGGHFTTIANREESKYNYYSRNIDVQRSNVVIDGLTHVITDEPLDHGAPYGGFVSINNCADVTVQNCKFSAHRTYTTIGAAGLPVSMGTYDLLVNSSVNITFKDCVQLNDITDDSNWGIFGSNFTKNIVFDSVVFSRFDAHKGTTNPVIRNSEIGHMGIKLIGSGTCLIENTKVTGHPFVYLRDDYGSTWEGEIIIRNCEFTPRRVNNNSALVIGALYSGMHDFGYPCFMPRKITIDGLVINDGQPAEGYSGPRILSAVHANYMDESFEEKYPYSLPEIVEIKGVTTKSGKDWVLSDNMYLFKDVRVL